MERERVLSSFSLKKKEIINLKNSLLNSQDQKEGGE